MKKKFTTGKKKIRRRERGRKREGEGNREEKT